MKIVSVHVHSFGKLKNVTVEFKGGTNVFRYDNGYGKTTLASFIRAMLYGFSYRRAGGISDASVWITWNSTEKIGGNMVVEHNGETYKIERFFGATAKQETLSVTNAVTQKPLDVGEGVGEYFLGLTAESYDRSAYYPQESVEITSNENLNTRLAGMVQNVADDYDKVQENLRKYKKSLRYERGNGGEICRLQEEISSLQRRIIERKENRRQKQNIDRRLYEIAAEQTAVKKRIVEVNAELSSLQKKLAACAPSKADEAARAKINELRSKLNRQGNFEQDKARCDALAEQIDKTPEAARAQRPLSKPLLICGLLLALVGAILAGVGFSIHQQVVGIAGVCAVVIGAVLAVVAFFVKPSLKTMQAGEKDALITEYFTLAGKYVYCERLSCQEAQKALWEKYVEYVGDRRELESLSKTVSDNAPESDALQKEADERRNDVDLLHNRALGLSQEEGQLKQQSNSLQTDYVELQEKLDETKMQLIAAERKYAVAAKTADLLAQANEKLATSYLPDLCARCENLLSAVTGETYKLEMDRDFGVRVLVNGASRSLNSFSRGIREITLLCFRLAVSKLLFDGEIPFLIIDDAFVNFDEQNFLRATELIKNLVGTQVIYFTCHQRLGNLK
ncbi:MAG: AAA family ATPase [Corallococcus sp.]|nr:AAA family ATPase [Corallococcus sp.]MCM1359922.1 AAA family ATPase [Corallococcus sp.]MCM1395478.1 AAA family ATPase [Corallococcus sp.]